MSQADTPEGRRQHWAKDRADAQQRIADYKPSGKVDALCHDASLKASQWAQDDGLYPESYSAHNEPRYRVQQGLRAAHVGREDSAATLLLMRPVLHHLKNIAALLWIVAGLLLVVLWRVW